MGSGRGRAKRAQNALSSEVISIPLHMGDGSREWRVDGDPDGAMHRVDGPAIEHPDGYRAWCLNDQLHRVDGPAVVGGDGSEKWFLHGKEVSEATVKALAAREAAVLETPEKVTF